MKRADLHTMIDEALDKMTTERDRPLSEMRISGQVSGGILYTDDDRTLCSISIELHLLDADEDDALKLPAGARGPLEE